MAAAVEDHDSIWWGMIVALSPLRKRMSEPSFFAAERMADSAEPRRINTGKFRTLPATFAPEAVVFSVMLRPAVQPTSAEGVTAAEAAEAVLVPAELVAVTEKV